MIRFTRRSLYGTIISAVILAVITLVVLFRTQIRREGRGDSKLLTIYPDSIRSIDRFVTYISEKKDAEQKTREEKLVLHGETLVKAFTDFHYQQLGRARVSRKPLELDWRKYIELLTYHSELLENLYTCDRALYDSMNQNQTKFEHDLEELIQGVEFKARHLGGACYQCINLHDRKDGLKFLSKLTS
jgi:hypothetical protein